MRKSIALATLIALLLTGIAFQHYITSLPDLEEPVTISQARFSPDGSSISVSFRDKDGTVFQFGIRGSTGDNPESFPVFYIRNPELVPYVYWPGIGGPDERALLRILDGWIERHLAPELRARLEQNDTEGFDQSEMELAAVYEIYDILRQRHPR
ncbi:hypothetical protein LPB19_09000 [Marinobacter salinisoli]|uniref:Uncharacterized protein n=1 Tax=Marinobacter salinisoli TaxID=2769486 RepID=A0ABX7MPS3_9GAMM|nr:hypothetical protein [Marinobacter salinisoli]QSP93374.1 hypothetical protein LPB19_09000 [Marinobacter salinisoli]